MALGMGSAYGYGVLDDNECSRGGYCFALKVPKGERDKNTVNREAKERGFDDLWKFSFLASVENPQAPIGTFHCSPEEMRYTGYAGLDKSVAEGRGFQVPKSTKFTGSMVIGGPGIGACYVFSSLLTGELSRRFDKEIEIRGSPQWSRDNEEFQKIHAKCNFIKMRVNKKYEPPLLDGLECYKSRKQVDGKWVLADPILYINLVTLQTEAPLGQKTFNFAGFSESGPKPSKGKKRPSSGVR